MSCIHNERVLENLFEKHLEDTAKEYPNDNEKAEKVAWERAENEFQNMSY